LVKQTKEREREITTPLPKKKKFLLLPSLLELSWGGRGKNKKDFIGQRKTKSTLYSPNMGMYVHTFY
jgi:hypothetical protein